MTKDKLEKEYKAPLFTFLDLPQYEYVNGIPVQKPEKPQFEQEGSLDPGETTKVDGGTFITYQNTNYSHSKSALLYNHNFKINKPKGPPSSKNNPSDPPRKHPCPFEGCLWAFQRLLDLTRHIRSHEKPKFHCPYWKSDPSCHRNGGLFNRLDVLKRHLKLVHYVHDRFTLSDEFPGEETGWCRSCQRMFQNTKVFIDHCEECANASFSG